MIVGLGNPGPEYAHHRHNVGFQVLDILAQRHGATFDKHQKRARLAVTRITLPSGPQGRVLLVKPMTYMNASGEAVGALATFYKIAPEDLLVIHDDLDLPLGRIRLRPGGGAGGHKGVASIIRRIGAEGFGRLRVGIGRPGGEGSQASSHMDPADYVLQPFSVEQEKTIGIARERAADAVETWLEQGIEAAMNRCNCPE